MSDIDLLITQAAQAVLQAARPSALPATLAIRAEADTEIMERPVIVFAIEEAESRHPRVRVGTLELRLLVREDETDAEVASAWHKAATDFFRDNPAAMAATLAPHGVYLKKLVPGTVLDTRDAQRGRTYVMPFLFVAQKS